MRRLAVSMKAMFSAMFCRVLAPMRGRVASSPEASLAFSDGTSVTPPCSHSSFTVLGPRPGTRSTSIRPAGRRASSSSCSAMRPVVANSMILRALLAPMPSMASSAFGMRRATAHRSSAASSATRATLRMAFTLKAFSPSSSRQSPISLKRRAMSALLPMWSPETVSQKANPPSVTRRIDRSAAGGTRTCNPKLRRLVLYPIELQPRGERV